MSRRKAPCPLPVGLRACFIAAVETDDLVALRAASAALEGKVVAWQAFTGRKEDLALGVRDAVERFTRDPDAGERLLREALHAISRRVLALRRAADREARPARGDPGLRSRDPAVRAKARARIWG